MASLGHFLLGYLSKMVCVIAPSDILKCLVKRAKLLRWSEMQIDEMENGVVVLNLSEPPQGGISIATGHEERKTVRGIGAPTVRSRRMPCANMVGST